MSPLTEAADRPDDLVHGISLAAGSHQSNPLLMVSVGRVEGGFAVQMSVPFDLPLWEKWVEQAFRVVDGYGPEPLIPDSVIADQIALRVGVTRPGLTASFDVRDDGRMGLVTLRKSRLRAVAELTSDEITTRLTSVPDSTHRDLVLPLILLARARASARGDATSSDGNVVGVDEQDRPSTGFGSGRHIVIELATLANFAFALWATARRLPIIQRHNWHVQTPQGTHDMTEFSVDNSGHARLGLAVYAQFTNGPRQLPDYLNLWTVVAALHGDKLPFDVETMRILSAFCTSVWQSRLPPGIAPFQGVIALTCPRRPC